MGKQILVGVTSKNILKPSGYTNRNHIGVTYSCDSETQEYTLNGTTNNNGDILLESNINLEWEVGTKYTITIIQTGGTATLGGSSGISYSFSIFTMNNSSYIRNGNLSVPELPGEISFTGNAIAENGGSGYKLYLQLWRTGTTFDNYKFKIQIEKGTSYTGYQPYFKNTAKLAKDMKVGVDNVARKVKKVLVGVNDTAKLIWQEEISKEQTCNFKLIYDGTLFNGQNWTEEAGGFIVDDIVRDDFYEEPEIDTTYMRFQGGGNSGNPEFMGLYTINPISIKGYSSLGVIMKLENCSDTNLIVAGDIGMSTVNKNFYEEISMPNDRSHYDREIPMDMINVFLYTDISGINYSEGYPRVNVNGFDTAAHIFGMFLYGEDDWYSVCKMAGLNPDNYTTIDEFISALGAEGSSYLEDESLVDYILLTCTGDFMIHSLTNRMFYDRIHVSSYGYKFSENKYWGNFLNIINECGFPMNGYGVPQD